MKIGIDCHNLEGNRTGVGRYLLNLLREWPNPSGSDPDGLGGRLQSIEFVLYFKNEIPEDVFQLSKDAGWTARNLGVSSNAIFKHWVLPRAAAKDKANVLFCPDYVLPLPLTLFSFYTKILLSQDFCIKTAVTIHDIIYESRPNEYSWPSWKDKILLKWASKQSAKKADIIFAPSEFTKSEILKYYGVSSQKVVITPLAPDPIFKPRKDVNPAGSDPAGLQKYGISDKYVFFVGSIFNRRFLPQKIEAFTEFARSCPEYQFLIIGKNHTKPFQDIGALVEEENIKLGREAIIWKEQAMDKELVYLYNGAFATLWLSSYEGFGLPVLESMACGTPVITSPYGSLPEVVGDAAMYVRHPENQEETAGALTRLASNDTYRKELISKGLARATKFSWRETARQTLDPLILLAISLPRERAGRLDNPRICSG